MVYVGVAALPGNISGGHFKCHLGQGLRRWMVEKEREEMTFTDLPNNPRNRNPN